MEDYSKKNTIKKFLNIPKHYILMVKNSPKNKGFSRIFPLAQSKGYQYNKVKGIQKVSFLGRNYGKKGENPDV